MNETTSYYIWLEYFQMQARLYKALFEALPIELKMMLQAKEHDPFDVE